MEGLEIGTAALETGPDAMRGDIVLLSSKDLGADQNTWDDHWLENNEDGISTTEWGKFPMVIWGPKGTLINPHLTLRTLRGCKGSSGLSNWGICGG